MISVAALPIELWEKISYSLADHPPSLCLLSRTSTSLRQIVDFVVGHYEAHLHVSFPDTCNEEEGTSMKKVEFEMILNRKGRFHHLKPHCHSHFHADASKVDVALDDILDVFSQQLVTLRLNNAPSQSKLFTVFNKYNIRNMDAIYFNGGLPVDNGMHDMLHACPSLKRVAISAVPTDTDFSKFWPHLKGTHVETLDLMDMESFFHSVEGEFRLPPSLKQLFFCPKRDTACEHAKNLANLLYSGNWNRVYIHSDGVLKDLNSQLHKDLKTVKEFCFSCTNFALNHVITFMKRCPVLQAFNWYGLHSCVAPIVIARMLNELPRKIVFSGCVACKSGTSVGNGGFMEVSSRVTVVQVTNLLQKPEFQETYSSSISDLVLFEKPNSQSAVMFMERKDSHCGPFCIDIHEISKKAGLSLTP